MKKLSRLGILPLLVLVAALSFGVRLGDFVSGVSDVPGSANAQEKTAEPLGKPPVMAKAEGDTPAAEVDPSVLPAAPTMGGEDSEAIDWRDSTESEYEYTTLKVELFEDLKNRRQELDQQKRELSVREALLKTAEKELDQKYQELISLKTEIESLLVTQSDEEQKRIVSLVKIYEGMKPKDAARIFNTLDLDILLAVVSQMSERKSAPVIASMSPERARTLTTMLMDQKSLNEIQQNLIQ